MTSSLRILNEKEGSNIATCVARFLSCAAILMWCRCGGSDREAFDAGEAEHDLAGPAVMQFDQASAACDQQGPKWSRIPEAQRSQFPVFGSNKTISAQTDASQRTV